jgi:hypothetical protein
MITVATGVIAFRGGVAMSGAMRIARAASVYFAIAFGAGFVLGTLRVGVLELALGSLAALLVELPIMLAVSAVAARWVVRRYGPPRGREWTLRAALSVGAIAWAQLQLAELAIAPMVLAGSSGGWWAAHWAKFATLAGALGAGAQAVFAMLPLAMVWRRACGAGHAREVGASVGRERESGASPPH